MLGNTLNSQEQLLWGLEQDYVVSSDQGWFIWPFQEFGEKQSLPTWRGEIFNNVLGMISINQKFLPAVSIKKVEMKRWWTLQLNSDTSQLRRGWKSFRFKCFTVALTVSGLNITENMDRFDEGRRAAERWYWNHYIMAEITPEHGQTG